MTEEKEGIAHNRQEFQVERLAFFSDAVFAIAITLLIIEIKVPEMHEDDISDSALLKGLLMIVPKFIGFIVSFFVIALYWMSHHRLFRYIIQYNQKLLWSNTLFLLFIVIMPFSTGLYSEYSYTLLHTPLILYTVNICCCGFFSYRLWHIAGNKKYGLSHGLSHIVLQYNSVRALLIPGLFILLSLVSYISPRFSYFTLIFLPLIARLVWRYYHRKYPELAQEHLK